MLDYRESKYYGDMDLSRAIGLAEGSMEPKDKGGIEILTAWQWLVDFGNVGKLKGWFGRIAYSLLEEGVLKYPKYYSKETINNEMRFFVN